MQLRSFGGEVMLEMVNRTEEADGFIVSTFYELEAPPIDAIHSPGKVRKLFLIGPVSATAQVKGMPFAGKPDDRGRDCMQWLDSRPARSVVYICFGSLTRFSPVQMSELALALDASDQSFLWALSRGVSDEAFSNLEELLPPNFRARTSGRGMIVDGWVPQQQILAHPSIGGFVTHRGWNSVLESILSGVPMIAWPQMNNDQFINCQHLVDVLKIAVEVGQTTTPFVTPPVSRVELEKGLRLLMSEEGSEMRSRVLKLKMKAEELGIQIYVQDIVV
ncbi:protein MpUGT6 [Marchantia polymorpha subsp. ruderalis]